MRCKIKYDFNSENTHFVHHFSLYSTNRCNFQRESQTNGPNDTEEMKKKREKFPSNNIKVTKAVTMTIAVINAIKNKFTCLKKEFERNTRNERQTQFMAWQSSVARIGSDRIPGI